MGKAYALIVRTRRGLRVVAVSSDGLHTEWPIMYDNGVVAYDNPYVIPQYIKPTVRRLLTKLESGTVTHLDISDGIAPPNHMNQGVPVYRKLSRIKK